MDAELLSLLQEALHFKRVKQIYLEAIHKEYRRRADAVAESDQLLQQFLLRQDYDSDVFR